MSSAVVYVGPQARALAFLDSHSAEDRSVLAVDSLDEATLADERVGCVVVDPAAEIDPSRLAAADAPVVTTQQADLPESVVDERVPAEGDAPTALAGAAALADAEVESLRAQLAALQETTRELIVAQRSDTVAEITVSAAKSVLDMPATSLWTYDETEEALVPTAMTDAVRGAYRGAPPPISADNESLWPLYEQGAFQVFQDIEYRIDATDTVVRSAIVAPLGEQGLLITATESSGFDDTETELFRLLASAAGSALSRTERERELQRQNERLDQFTSVVSHDLQTPIQLAITQLELYRETGDEAHLDELAAAHDRMTALIDDLLALARQGDTVDAPEQVVLSRVAEDAWRGIDTEAARLRIDGDATLDADPVRLDQLCSNLFRNAVEHTAGDPVTVSVGLLDDGRGFYVADDGPGIPPIDRDRVFERGYTTTDGGTGFGLAIVAEIVDAHGWSIAVTESDAGGARFEISGVASLDPVD